MKPRSISSYYTKLGNITLAVAASSWLCAFSTPESTSKTLYGMEVELPYQNLAYVLPYFELEAWEGRVAQCLFDDYAIVIEKTELRNFLQAPFTHVHKTLTPAYLARCVVRAVPVQEVSKVQLKVDIPQNVRETLQVLNWKFDNNYWEFINRSALNNADTFMQQAERFFALTHFSRTADNPIQNLGKTHLHIHFSLKDGADLTTQLHLYSIFVLFEFIKNGAIELAIHDRYPFSHDLKSKGLVRIITPNHIELRNHILPFRSQVGALNELFLAPTSETVAKLGAQVWDLLQSEHGRLLFKTSLPTFAGIIKLLFNLKVIDANSIDALVYENLSTQSDSFYLEPAHYNLSHLHTLFPTKGTPDLEYPKSKPLFMEHILKNPQYYFSRVAQFKKVISLLSQSPQEESQILESARLIRHITQRKHGVFRNNYSQNFRDLYLASAQMRRVAGFMLRRRETSIRTIHNLGPLCFLREELEGLLLSTLEQFSDREYSNLLYDLENIGRHESGSYSKKTVAAFLERGLRQNRFSPEYQRASRLYTRFFGNPVSRLLIRPFIKCWSFFIK